MRRTTRRAPARGRCPGALAAGALAWAVVTARAATPATAQEPPPLVTDRPDQTESPAAVPGGLFQLEMGWLHTGDDAGGTRHRAHAVPSALLRVGLGGGLEARFGFAGWISEREEAEGEAADTATEGAGDAEVGFKWALSEGGSGGAAVALLASLSLPVGADGLSSGRPDPSLRLAVGHDVGARVSLGGNLGVARETVEGDARRVTRTDLLYTAALGWALADRVGAFVEGFGFFGVGAERPDRHLVDAGVTWLALPTLQLDLSGGLGLSEAAEDWFIGAGASLRLPR